MMKKMSVSLMTLLLFAVLTLFRGFALAELKPFIQDDSGLLADEEEAAPAEANPFVQDGADLPDDGEEAAPAAVKVKPIIQDDADLLTDEEEAALYEEMLPLREYGTPMLWTTNYKSESLYDNTGRNFYDQRLGSGMSGMLLVINPRRQGNEMLSIISEGGFYYNIIKGKDESIRDNAYRAANRQNYYDCARAVFRKTRELCRNDKAGRDMKLYGNIVLALTLALFAAQRYITRSHMKDLQSKEREPATVPVSLDSQARLSLTTSEEHRDMVSQRKRDITIEDD